MLGALERLLKKENESQKFKKESQKLKNSKLKIQKKISRVMYLCKECGHLYFYSIVSCPLCESRNTHIVEDVVNH